jgi:hypothetical protein
VRASARSIALTAASLSIAALPCLAQRPTASANPSDQDSQFGTIAGTVVSANTNEPLKKAQGVIANEEAGSDEHPQTATSDASGHFSIEHVAAGRYDLRVACVGYLATQYGQDKADKPGAVLTLVAGQKMTDLLFRLQRTAVIAGRITDEDGEPVRQASVEVFSRTTVRGKFNTEQAGAASTDDLGEYRVFDLPPGNYFIVASWPRGEAYNIMQGATQQEVGYPAMYFPGTTDVARASVIEVKSGDEVPGIDISFARGALGRTYKIHGHVLNSISGHPDANVMVMLGPRTHDSEEQTSFGIDAKSARPDENTGEFEIDDVPPGEYIVMAISFDGGKIQTGTQSVHMVGWDVRDVSILLTRGIDVSGRVTFDGQTAASASGMSVSLSPSEAEARFNPGGQAKVQPDGSFVLTGVGDGSYSINLLSKCAVCYVKSAKSNGVDLLEHGVQVGSGNVPSNISIVYSSNTATVNGSVTAKDDLPAPGCVASKN